MSDQALRQLREPNLSDVRRVDDDLVPDLPYRAAVIGEQNRLGRRQHLGLVSVRPQHQCDFLSNVLVEQLLRREQIVLVVLLDYRQRVRRGERFDVNGGGVDLLGDASELERRFAFWESYVAAVAHKCNVDVVDGDGY